MTRNVPDKREKRGKAEETVVESERKKEEDIAGERASKPSTGGISERRRECCV